MKKERKIESNCKEREYTGKKELTKEIKTGEKQKQFVKREGNQERKKD